MGKEVPPLQARTVTPGHHFLHPLQQPLEFTQHAALDNTQIRVLRELRDEELLEPDLKAFVVLRFVTEPAALLLLIGGAIGVVVIFVGIGALYAGIFVFAGLAAVASSSRALPIASMAPALFQPVPLAAMGASLFTPGLVPQE